jgi:hypothetical protein
MQWCKLVVSLALTDRRNRVLCRCTPFTPSLRPTLPIAAPHEALQSCHAKFGVAANCRCCLISAADLLSFRQIHSHALRKGPQLALTCLSREGSPMRRNRSTLQGVFESVQKRCSRDASVMPYKWRSRECTSLGTSISAIMLGALSLDDLEACKLLRSSRDPQRHVLWRFFMVRERIRSFASFIDPSCTRPASLHLLSFSWF